jgi:DNA-binding CsgD family transcriptional regulator
MDPDHRRKQYDMLGRVESFRLVRSPGLLDFIQALIRRLFRRPAPRRAPTPPLLTRRERQVLELVGRGYTNREIADVLGIAPETVKTHLANIRAKLGLSNKAELRYWLIEHFPPNSPD